MIFTISLAGFAIRVESIHDEVFDMCASYLAPDAEPDFRVAISPADIAAEREKARRQDEREGRIPEEYSDAYLETLAVYRQIAETMPARGVFLMHGSAVALGESCWLFTAPSGVGKTTHTKLWLESIEGSYVVNGDKPLIRRREDAFAVCGTPWSGKEGWNRNTMVPLKGIVFLSRGAENSIVRASAADTLPLLIGQTYRPMDVGAQKRTLELLQALCGQVPFYKLTCNMEPAAALTAFAGVTQD